MSDPPRCAQRFHQKLASNWNPLPNPLPKNPLQDSQNPIPEDFFQDLQDPMALDSQTTFWPCWICGAIDSDDEDHINCNLSTSP